jgi:DNA-binding GntR family transcriptional regulator
MSTSVALPRINTYKVSDAAYDILREKIISREFGAGQRLNLDEMEKQLGISRTPIKEALARLEMEGLVRIVPRSGTFVTDPGPEEIAESFDVRRVLEVYAVELAIQRMTGDDVCLLRGVIQELEELAAVADRDAIYPRYLALDHQFHQQLIALAGNERLQQAHYRENLHAQMARIRYRRSERELDVAQGEHQRLMAALEARDIERAKREMDAHLRRAKRSLLNDLGIDSQS